MESTPPTSSQQFVRPRYDYGGKNTGLDARACTNLPELVEFNAVNNRNHLFCLQYNHRTDTHPRLVTYEGLHLAVLRCSVWLAKNGICQALQAVSDSGVNTKARPVGLLMASDLSWFIHFLALLRLGVPVSAVTHSNKPVSLAL